MPSKEWIAERLADYKACRSHREIAAIESMLAEYAREQVEANEKENEAGNDETESWVHKQLDALGIPTSKALPGKAYDGFLSRVTSTVTDLRAQLQTLRGKHERLLAALKYYEDRFGRPVSG